MAEATPCEVYTDEDGLRVADVPVQLLQQDWRICVYGYDSAVRTINSLPDLSGNTGAANTIIFKGEAGSRTDGGAINTMTEEEIAVATAKGWVISFV